MGNGFGNAQGDGVFECAGGIRARKKAQQQLRDHQRAEGLDVPSCPSISNRKCPYKNEEEERSARLDAVSQQVKVYRTMLPVLLKRLNKIEDTRNPKRIRHKMTVLLIYGILCFAFQMASRREATREITRPMFMANLRKLFPELENLPHHDTLAFGMGGNGRPEKATEREPPLPNMGRSQAVLLVGKRHRLSVYLPDKQEAEAPTGACGNLRRKLGADRTRFH